MWASQVDDIVYPLFGKLNILGPCKQNIDRILAVGNLKETLYYIEKQNLFTVK